MPQTGSSDDVVDDGLERSTAAGARERRRPGRRDERRPPAPDLDELGEDRQGDLLRRLRAEVHAGRRPERSEPLLRQAGVVAEPLANDVRPGSARRRDRHTDASRRSAAASASSSHWPWVATTT
jgi:hypothetical protein